MPAEWAISREVAHEPMVSVRDFAAAQVVRIRADDVDHRDQYALVGLVQCGVCGRRMDPHWVHGRPGIGVGMVRRVLVAGFLAD